MSAEGSSHAGESVALWRKPRKGGAHAPLVVLLHGRGADETDLIDLANLLPPSYAYVSLRGLVPAEGGYTWFENRGPARPISASVRSSVEVVRAWLDGPQTAAFDRKRTYLLGFSAGMMMAGALAIADPARFGGAVLLSGALALDAGLPATPGRLAGFPVFYGVGTLDDVIPGDLAARATSYLRDKSGADLTLREYPHGHSISRGEIGDIRSWLEERA